MFATVIISAKAAKKISAGHPWVYAGDILSRRFGCAGIVGVVDKSRKFIGQAFYSPKSKIALRFITRSKERIDKDFWVNRVKNAFKRRSPQKASDAFRVVHAESDGMPSIVIDKYNDIVSFQITSAGAESVKGDIVSAIKAVLEPASIIEKDNVAAREKEGLPMIEKAVFGEKTATIVCEAGQKFEVDVLHGQKTGAYLDYRAFRLKARELSLRAPSLSRGEAISRKQLNSGDCFVPLRRTRNDERVALDLFCYQGWFACHLAGTGICKIVAVDASKDAIEAAKRNAELNGIPVCHSRGSKRESHEIPAYYCGDDRGIEFVCEDAFEFLTKCNDKFDFIHLDPPPFAKGKEALPAALKGYKKLLTAAFKLLKPEGVLFVSSCSHHVSEGLLEKMIAECAKISNLKFQIIFRGIQDKDHPVLKGFSESLYLKAIAGRISVAK